MAIETWNSPYIVFWLCFGALMTVLTYGVQGYNGKVSRLGAAGYSMLIGALSLLDGAALGQYMYDEKAKYDFWGSIGTALGVSGPLLVSSLILLIFYSCRLVKHPDEVVVRGENVEVSRSYLLSGITTFFLMGVMMAGIGSMYIVMAVVGDRRGVIYGIAGLMPLVIAIWLIVKYRKWMFRYIVWLLKHKGLLQVVDEENSNPQDE